MTSFMLIIKRKRTESREYKDSRNLPIHKFTNLPIYKFSEPVEKLGIVNSVNLSCVFVFFSVVAVLPFQGSQGGLPQKPMPLLLGE
jgi:hypothetical protein